MAEKFFFGGVKLNDSHVFPFLIWLCCLFGSPALFSTQTTATMSPSDREKGEKKRENLPRSTTFPDKKRTNSFTACSHKSSPALSESGAILNKQNEGEKKEREFVPSSTMSIFPSVRLSVLIEAFNSNSMMPMSTYQMGNVLSTAHENTKPFFFWESKIRNNSIRTRKHRVRSPDREQSHQAKRRNWNGQIIQFHRRVKWKNISNLFLPSSTFHCSDNDRRHLK